MVFDVFHYFNEESVLKIRLAELAPVVDRFVILEATKTFSGHDKPLNFDKSLLDQFPIEYHVIEDDLITGSAWQREWRQRQLAKDYVNPKPDDVVIYSDLDEIPRATVIKEFHESPLVIRSLEMTHFYYYLNLLAKNRWDKGKIITGGYWNDSSIADIRGANWANVIFDAGWHFAYMGGVEKLIYKIQSFSHCDDANIPGLVKDYTAGVRPEVRNRDEYGLRIVNIDDGFPASVRENIEHYKSIGMVLAPEKCR
jgi:beta-1,4-mannosyl-glycoprotein beta-1,4-N-acetylglucosaminyltransferase